MARPRVRTARIGGNQERIDELEYFLESIGHELFGAAGEDYRVLGHYVPRTRNLSALVAHGRTRGRDVAEDLRFLLAELGRRRGAVPVGTPDFRTDLAVLRYDRYLDLLAHPERLLDRVQATRRLEVASLITAGLAQVAPATATVNAYAWLSAVGLPDLEAELAAKEPPRVALAAESAGAAVGLEKIIGSLRRHAGPGLRAYLGEVWRDLCREYRGQLARLAARTQPFA